MVVTEDRKLIHTITDGDIRRAILAKYDLETSVQIFLDSAKNESDRPITALIGSSHEYLLKLMQEKAITQIPIIDHEEYLIDLITWDDIIVRCKMPLQAVIMAGGFGTRLRPLTENLPKPMLPLGNKPLLERTIIQLRNAGINHVDITTHYKPEKIVEYFGDGQDFDIDIQYIQEENPMGTAGALGLMPLPDKTLLVINGDILTQINFQKMFVYHSKHQAALTVAVRQYEYKIPYGVMENDGPFVRAIREKPSYHFFVNAGIYLLEPSVYQHIPTGVRFNMTDLIERLIAHNEVVVNFPIIEYWLDIGRHEDYEQAQADILSGKVSA